MESVSSAIKLSRGSVWKPQYSERPYLFPSNNGLQRWPSGASAYIVFTDTAGAQLHRLDGDVYPDRIEFFGESADMDELPNGTNFEIYLEDDDGTHQIRHGKVIRTEVTYTTPPSQVSYTPLSFSDSFQRTALGRKWQPVWGRTKIHNNTGLSLPNGVAVENAFFNESAIRFWQEFSSDSIEVGVTVVNPLNLQAGKTGFIIGADINMTCGLVMQLETGISNNFLHIGTLDGPTTVIHRTSPVPNVTANHDYYRIRYIDSTKTIAIYKGTSLAPMATWVDETEMLPKGKGYRHFGMNFEASLFTQGIQVTSCAARDAA